jgi:hypothetical protein
MRIAAAGAGLARKGEAPGAASVRGPGAAARREDLLARSAPPFRLPGEHFAAALVFWLLGALGLVWVAPDLALGLFPLPRVIAVTHLFTLGWITTTILGALYQFLPVALQVPIRSERVAHVGFALYVPGLLLFAWGSLTVSRFGLVVGAAALAAGLLLFVGNLAATLWRSPERGVTWWALAAAAVFLLVTVALGSALSGNLRWNYLGADRFLALGVHVHVALAGWVMLVMVGVAHRLLPMFLLSHGASEWPGRLSVALLVAGTGLLVALHHRLEPGVKWTVAALLAGGVVAFVAQAALFFRHRRKPALDPGLRLVAVGLFFVAVALALAPAFLAGGIAAPRIAVAYLLALVLGGISLFVAGHYYKILPFLVWFHRFGPLVGTRAVPLVTELYSGRTADVATALLGIGTAGLIVATLLGEAGLARPCAALFAAGALVVALQMLAISLRRPE